MRFSMNNTDYQIVSKIKALKKANKEFLEDLYSSSNDEDTKATINQLLDDHDTIDTYVDELLSNDSYRDNDSRGNNYNRSSSYDNNRRNYNNN